MKIRDSTTKVKLKMVDVSDIKSSTLIKDLKKPRKDYLIDLIILQRLPSNINGEVLVKCVEQLIVKVSANYKPSCSNLQPEYSCSYANGDLQSLRRGNYHLEKGILDQEHVIILLKDE